MAETRYTHCQRCMKELEVRKAVYLNWDTDTKTFSRPDWDNEDDVFRFGLDCAKKLLDPKFDTLKEIRTSRKLWNWFGHKPS